MDRYGIELANETYRVLRWIRVGVFVIACLLLVLIWRVW